MPCRPPMLPAALMLLLAVPAFGQDPPKPPAPAHAVAVSRPAYPTGTVVFVDASGSTSAWPLQIAVVGRPNEPKSTLDGGLGAIFPALPDGTYFIAVTASAPVEGKAPAVDTAVVPVTVGPLQPADTPDTIASKLDAMAAALDAGFNRVVVEIHNLPINPPPAPPSPPVPTPTPVPASDRLGLTTSTRSLLRSMTWSAEAVRWRQDTLAPIFATVAANAATYASGQAMILDLESKYKTAIGPAAWPQWNTGVFSPLKAQLTALTAAKKIVTVADLAEAFAEIGAAMKEGSTP